MAGTDIHELPIVDAHHHFFNLGRVRYPWLTDRPEDDFLLGDYEALKRDYLPADYARDAAGFNIVAQVHVEAEADHENPLAETAWLSELNRSAGVPHAIVGHAWLHRRSSEAVIAAQAASPLVRGIRSKP
ncbi:MAG: amidohydrolase, partial [Alphaproteobacteria bacterium]|nr:amidohydrolase [Alphaproteobacteria bacterium]